MQNRVSTNNGLAAVSVVIVNHNAGDLLPVCVNSALTQACEVLVVDNASVDSSLQQLESRFGYAPRLQIVRNRENLGFAAGCNIGFRQSAEQLVLFLNPDCVLTAGSLSRMLATLRAAPDSGMLGCLLVGADGKEQGGGRRAVPTPWRSFVRAFGLTRLSQRWPRLFCDFHLHKQPLPDSPVSIEAISGALMLVRRDALEAVGYWDEGYFLHCEDLDLCMRFRQSGWNILFDPGASAIHFHGTCSKARPLFVEWHKHKGMVRFYRKFFRHQYPGFLMWLVIFGVWTRFLMSATLKACCAKEQQTSGSRKDLERLIANVRHSSNEIGAIDSKKAPPAQTRAESTTESGQIRLPAQSRPKVPVMPYPGMAMGIQENSTAEYKCTK
jgi:GT2 family glycosyltransferase